MNARKFVQDFTFTYYEGRFIKIEVPISTIDCGSVAIFFSKKFPSGFPFRWGYYELKFLSCVA